MVIGAGPVLVNYMRPGQGILMCPLVKIKYFFYSKEPNSQGVHDILAPMGGRLVRLVRSVRTVR